MLIANRTKLAIQNGIATFVKNNNGIPTTVMPIIPNNAIIPMHTLWQTWYEPRKLVIPENIPVMENAFSFLGNFIIALQNL